MANTAQATKRAHQSRERSARNGSQRSRFRTAVKNLRKAVEDKHTTVEMKVLQETSSIIDKSVTKGLIHRNKAARLKSRLNNSLRKQAKA